MAKQTNRVDGIQQKQMESSGYTQIERLTMGNSAYTEDREFEILDVSTGTKEILFIPGIQKAEPKKEHLPKEEPKVAKKKTIKPKEATYQEPPIEFPKATQEKKIIKIYSDITEVTIEVLHYYYNETFVCLFMDKDSNTKLKPKTGIELDIEIEDERFTVYSPGVYVPSTPFGCDVVFLLVVPQEES